jgi:hypothetical protein
MVDIRQGPLTVVADPLSTSAERCVAGILDPFAPLPRGARTLSADETHPHVIAPKGYVPAPGWPRAYYLEGDDWLDTETGVPWPNPLQQRFAAAWAAKFGRLTP